MGEETDIEIQEPQRSPNKINRRSIPKHIIIKMTKSNDKENFKDSNSEQLHTKETP